MEIYCRCCGEPLPWGTKLVPMVKGKYFCVDCFRDSLVNEKTKDMDDEMAEKFIADLEELDDKEVVKEYADEWVDYNAEISWLEEVQEFRAVEAKSGYYENI